MTTNKNSPAEFPAGELKITLQGPEGELELLTQTPTGAIKPVVVVICHPHPLYGGTLNNKVVYTLARAFKDMELRTVRFNFRGVGASAGSYAQGIGETDDLLAILRWVQQVRPNDSIWLAGFSFGAFVAARGGHLWPTTQQLVTIAPPVENFDFNSLPPVNCPWLIVQGDQDEVVAPAAVYNWLATLPNPPQLIRMPEATHFFHGQLVELRELLITVLSPRLTA